MGTGAGLPTGTVTFLFTDIEGSTRLLQEAGIAYATLLEEHRRLLRSAVVAHGGREVNVEGDSLFVAFPSAREAVAAAAEAQQALRAHRWPPGRRVRVRMGLHSGEGTVVAGDYVSLAVHRAARIAGSAHGGQVLLSEATAALVGDALDGELSLRDLGEHRLKDFPRPARLFQLEGPDLEREFPPVRTLTSPTLPPSPPGRFVGRERDVEAIAGLLGDGRRRLVTLTGLGGIGKTRLALEAARAVSGTFPDGVVFVPLASVDDPNLVLGSVADAVGAQREAGVPLLDAVADALGQQRKLLVLDNFEQVLEAAVSIADLLDRAPAVVALVTSRRALQVRSEQRYHVGPLTQAEAVRLFSERAAAIHPGFALTDENAAAVHEIARHLDGLPLAIELAAARVRLLPPDALLARMSEKLDVLGRGAVDLPERQRTLRATMDWSYSLLGPHDQVVFARLAVFAGGWTLAAAEEVCGRAGEPDLLDTLSELLANSLVVETGAADPEPRLTMLETVRAYAGERLAALPDRPEVERRHTCWMLALATERFGKAGRDHRVWFERFQRERANLRAVVQRALDADDLETVARLSRDAFVPLAHRDAEAEVVEWLDEALTRDEVVAPATRGRLLAVRALAATIFGDYAAARSLLRGARELLPHDNDHVYDHALAAATEVYEAMAGDPGPTPTLIETAARRLAEAGDRLGQAYLEVTAGHRELQLEDLPAAERHYANGAELAEQLADDELRGRALSLLGLTLLARGEVERAGQVVVDGARASRHGGQPTSIAYSLDGLAAMALATGRAAVAARALASAAAIRERARNPASPAFRPLLEQLVARSRAALGDAAYASATAEAETWEVGEAVDRILEALDATA
jgi:predicted ATPase/class 3 adenylate cyclase